MNNLNESQRNAVECDDKKILCLAGAGTGKTYTLIHRISRLIDDNLCRGSNVLALTFTNAAAFEMQERFDRLHPAGIASQPEFRTFHAFCYSLLSKDIAIRQKLGYCDVPKICTDEDVKRIQTTVKLSYGIKLSQKLIDNPTKISSRDQFEYDIYKKALKREFINQNLISFDTLCREVCALFTQNDPVTDRYKRRYSYIMIDEFQDTDPTQWEFAKSFTDSNLFIVGDALQALYGFRGADSTIIKQLANDPTWTVIKLFDNYRSSAEICDFANNMSVYADNAYRIALHSDRVENRTVCCDCFEDGDRFHSVSVEMQQAVLNGLNKLTGTTAILCRQNREVTEISQYLTSNDIDVTLQRSNIEAVQLLKSARDLDYMVDWIASQLQAESYANWIRMTSLYPDMDRKEKLDLFEQFVSQNVGARNLMRKVRVIRQMLKESSDPLVERGNQVFQYLKIRQRVEIEPHDLSELADYLVQSLEHTTESDIYVGTIHSSKGLEYDNVILLNVGGKSFSLSEEENLNCLYVGITRAKHVLKVYYSIVN